MVVPQSSGCFPLCLSLHGTCGALAQMYILVTHMIALQLPFHLTTVGPLAPYKSCVSHPCIARARFHSFNTMPLRNRSDFKQALSMCNDYNKKQEKNHTCLLYSYRHKPWQLAQSSLCTWWNWQGSWWSSYNSESQE